jgi:DNA-binding response OmpR family regulator
LPTPGRSPPVGLLKGSGDTASTALQVDVHVRRLRAELGPEHEQLIQTVRGVGYRASDDA